MKNIFKSLTFYTLLVGVAAFVVRFYFPAFPLDEGEILAVVLFLLGLVGIVPTLRARGALTADIVNSLAFWQLIAGFLIFVLRFFAPNLPVDEGTLLAIILFVLGFFNVYPELRLRGLL